ncbi:MULTISPECIES: isopeptide-forming domain-containing fimbrial protein [Vagococcus]|uniref:WxL domain-containing protein n=1 Tax=Vagococcus fluvialis bH819 TaxID=1255619 RepID=A0A1X6WK43_9ENTE|nr:MULTISPECIES: isopeptide-forming domain-containing fimbrial protein [Vagococcus]SLM84610.1 hypothetical protein FM121_00860 [Vagococcus fluvialis bH819]HCM89926.1 isopeptide-forming domain-containing fimbrial protein [Vagococcus sp.]
MIKKLFSLVIFCVSTLMFPMIGLAAGQLNQPTNLIEQEVKTTQNSRGVDIEQYQDFDPNNDWTEIFKMEEGRINLSSNQQLAYYFGPESFLGKDKSAPYNLTTPNINFINENEKIFAYYDAKYRLKSTLPILIGTNQTNMSGVSPTLDGSNTRYYKKELTNGLPAFLMVVEDDIRGIKASTIQYGVQTGFVRVNTRYTNSTKEVKKNTFFASTYDTMLNNNDDVPIKYLGNNKGLYIESGNYTLQYRFNVPDGPENWLGGHYLTLLSFFGDIGFKDIDSPGMEINNAPFGSVAADKIDTGISMKSHRMNLEPGKSFDMGYIVGIQKNDGEPVMTLNEEDQYFEGTDFKLSGEWYDREAKFVNLYYVLDDGQPIKFAENIPNTRLGESYEWETTISNLDKKNHKIKVYLVSSSEEQSKEKNVHLTYLLKPQIKEMVFHEDNSVANEAYSGEKLHYVIEVAPISDVKSNYENLTFITQLSEFLENVSTIEVISENGEKVEINNSDINNKQLIIELSKKIPLNEKLTVKYSAKIKKDVPAGKEIKAQMALEGTVGNQMKMGKVISNQVITKIIPTTGKLVSEVFHQNGTQALNGTVGETLNFSLKLSPNNSLKDRTYTDLKFSVNIDDKLEEPTNILLIGENREKIGTGFFDSQTRQVHFQLEKKIPTTDTVFCMYSSKIKPINDSGIISVKGSLIEGYADDVLLSKVDSNESQIKVEEGNLEFISSPPSVSFGNQLEIKGSKTEFSLYHKEGDLKVRDNRWGDHRWRMTARLLDDFKNTDNDLLKQTLFLRKNNQESIIGVEMDAVIKQESSSFNEVVNISGDWNENEGIFISIPPGTAKEAAYQAKIQWTLQDVPMN